MSRTPSCVSFLADCDIILSHTLMTPSRSISTNNNNVEKHMFRHVRQKAGEREMKRIHTASPMLLSHSLMSLLVQYKGLFVVCRWAWIVCCHGNAYGQPCHGYVSSGCEQTFRLKSCMRSNSTPDKKLNC